jgi:dimethylamine monooxygenase subunit A
MQVDWQRLFPDEPYRFHMGLRPGDPAQFFRPTPGHTALLAERHRWLTIHPRDYAGLEPDGVELLDETIALARAWDSIPAAVAIGLHPAEAVDAPARCAALGKAWEPDFLLLRQDAAGALRLVGGVVCFPSGWALNEKLGRDLTAIHGVVPRLNADLDRPIQVFFNRLRPGVAWKRENWGLAACPELNRHPARRTLPVLDVNATVDSTWVRVEHQIFVRLPRTRGVLFGIRVTVHPLVELMDDVAVAGGLLRALESMPPEVAAYKGLTNAAPSLIRVLREIQTHQRGGPRP